MSDPQLYLGMTESMAGAAMQCATAAAAAVAAVIIAIRGIHTQREIARKQKTAEHISSTDRDKDMISARQEFIKLSSLDQGLVKFADLSNITDKYVKARTDIRLILNDFELIAISIQEDVMDAGFYYKFHRGTVLKFWRISAPFVYHLRAATGNNRIYHEFEEMARYFDTERPPKRKFPVKSD